MNRSVTALLLVSAIAACSKKPAATVTIETAPVERREIIVDASATGVVEPINVVEVKSKASGQITQMPVETGTLVNPGDLLVQLDTRDVKNQYDQSVADLRSAEARIQVAESQKKRSDDLYANRIITAQEHETAALEFTNAQAQLVRARTNVDLAQQRLEDATVRAPVAGTVIEKLVSLGQVITSATGAFGGGTTLLKMADLNQVRVRALVNETDIGSVRPGQEATVTVDAYPDRPFRGTVEKIEPQAVVQQSVTMFPVLISLSNRDGLLKPGMNGEVSVLVEQRTGVLAVPNDAIRSVREVAATATMLGLDPDSVRAKLQAQASSGGGMMGGRPGGPGAPGGAPGTPREARGDVALDAVAQQGGGRGQGMQLPEVTDQQCAAVTAAFRKDPTAEQKLDALRTRARNGEVDFQQVREESQKIYAALGVDGRTAMACRMRDRGRQGGGQEGGAARQGPAPSSGAADGRRAGGQAARDGAQSPSPVTVGEFPMRPRTRPGLVFVAANGTYEPRIVRLGVGNLDYTEVVSGLQEGERVALLAAAAAQARRDEATQRFRGMTGGGVPGMQRTPPGGTPGGGGPTRGGPGR